MKKYLLLILFCYFNNNLYSQWDLRINGLPEWSVADVLEVGEDSTIVSFVRTSYLPRPISISNDLANSWNNYNTPDTWDGSDAAIIDKNNIWFCTEDGKIYYSNNGGINWNVQFEDTINYRGLPFIKFFNKNDGIVLGDPISAQSAALVLKTTDGGNSWISINSGSLIGEWSRDVFYPIEFPSISTGYFFGSKNNKLYKTIDGGASWQPLTLPTGVTRVNMIKFYNENIGMFVTLNYIGDNFIYRTYDGGNSWTKLSMVTNRNLHDIEFLPGSFSNVWFTNFDNLYFSDDTGNTWQEVPIVDSSLAAHNIEFLNDSIGFILCCDGKFFATENNGGIITSINDKNISVVNEYSLYQNYPNPFNPSTKINWQSPVSSWQTLKVYDVLGNEVTTLFEGYKPAGSYRVNFDATGLSSGFYFYKLTAGIFSETKKMILIR
jgi:photosystem II stability/assembly factor-like uncharacterized protein